ncbi:MAG: NAD(P)/FAD-dependent oxidoreductase [Flavobacteriales bacterium]
MNVAIIGGGAAGFFSAISVKTNHPNAKVVIIEKTKRVLSKVKVSGGGRCNVTNGCTYIPELITAYPRGQKVLKGGFRIFSTQDTMHWFESRHVPLVIQEDQCVFPKSQDSQSIMDCLLNEAKKLNIAIQTGKSVEKITPIDHGFDIQIARQHTVEHYQKVIVTTGGSPKRKGLNWLEELGHKIEHPVPSLFTFNMPMEQITKLMGIVVENALVTIEGTKLNSDGPLLITHWGMSGPAILKLSAFGARILAEKQYTFKTHVNWTGVKDTEEVRSEIKHIIEVHAQKKLSNHKPFGLQTRLWEFLLHKIELPTDKKWSELGKKGINKLIELLTNDVYAVSGKTTFKEEFVTCGGVSLKSINHKTMESKVCKGLYFAGEVLDIDGITGGYNFQAAWTTGFIAGKMNI